MNRGSYRHPALGLVLATALLAPAASLAQIAGENVNMVTGTQWPGGDPFLQRQNEPSLAVSSANPQHLLAGANDYRSVDVPYPFGPNDPMKMPGDAWLGVFKSYNGGQTWQSVLMPGFPQDRATLPSQGANSPLRNCVKGSTALADRCTSAADPVVRAGTDGMLYYSGIAFKRGTSWGKVFLSRFIDLNNKENGDATRTDPNDVTRAAPTDPIRFVDQVVIASSDGKVFLDKPWIAVDKPRLLSQTCKVNAPNPDGTVTTRTFPGGAIYASWIRFAPGEVTSDVMFSSSRDCGKTWTAAIKVNDATSSLNQAPSIAIDPFTGFVYVTWRRIQYPAAPAAPTQGDAILVARSFRGFLFTKPRVVADFRPFEQGSTGSMIRTHAFPSIAISVDKSGYNGWVHIAWPQRMGPHGDARVVTSTAPVLPPPLNGLESGDPCNGWTVPVPVDDHGLVAPYGEGSQGGFRTFTRGHQFMPSITFSQGKLVVLYYDSRFTHTASVFKPNFPFAPDPFGNFYREERVPIAPWNPATRSGEPENPANVFRAVDDTIDDAGMLNVRHTVEVRVGTSGPGKDPVFTSEQVSKYRFGERGDEPPYFKVPQFLGPDASSVSSRDAGLEVTDASTFLRLQQFDVNAPNLPMFKNGTVPFLGDYIDIQGRAFERKSTGWAFATAPTSAPVFHAVWTTNQDVRAPKDGDWTHYTPMKLPGQSGAIFDGATSSTPLAYCTPGTPGNEGTRNQNIYTARITEGLLVSSPQNVKPLSSSQTRSFVVAAHNDTRYPKAFRFTFTGIAPRNCSNGPGQAAPTSCASFSADASVPAVDVEILPHSSVTRSLFVRSTSVGATLTVNVNEIVRPDPAAPTPACSLAALDCAYVNGGMSGFVTLNPPGSNPALVPPDGSTTSAGTNETLTFANVSTANVSTANVSTANVSTANVSTANISTANVSTANVCTANVSTANVSTANVCTANVSTANVSTANVSTANVSTANVTTANISTANVSTANVSTANVSTANVSTANVSTANVSTANVSTANVSTAPVSDLNYEVTNTGNTTTSYSVQFVCDAAAGCPTATPLHLMVNKFYVIPASTGCQLVAEPRSVLVANGGFIQDAFVSPTSLIDPKTREGSASNATLSLAPGEKAQVTLRGRITVAEMAEIGTRIAPAVVPHGTPVGGSVGGTQTYASSTLVGLPTRSTQTTVTAGNGTFTATVVGVPATTVVPTGKVTFIAGGSQVLGVGPLDVAGKATLSASIPAGVSLVAYYGGDTSYKASSGSYSTTLSTTLSIQSDNTSPTVPGQGITIGFDLSAPLATPAPTGSVRLYDGATAIGSPMGFTCTAGASHNQCVGFFSLVPSPGSHSFSASYTGDAGYLPSTSAPLPWSVTSATVNVTGPTGPVLIGQAASFSASVVDAASQAVTWSVSPATSASISSAGVFQATAAGTYTVTATSVVDTAAKGTATLTIGAPSIHLSPGGTGPVNLLISQLQTFTATVGGVLEPVVTWSVSSASTSVTLTPAASTLAANFVATAAGTYTVTASASGVVASVDVLVTAPVASSPFGIGGAVNDGFVNVAVNRDSAAYNDATVTVTGAGGAVVSLARVGNGQYQTASYVLPAVGQPVTITVSGGGQTATATAVVPERPVITAPAQGSVLLAANPITVSWTSTTSPDDYGFDGWCGNGQCVGGAWTTVAGTERSVTFNGGFFPAGQTVQMGIYAFNRMALSGAALPASYLVVNNKAPTPGTWWTFFVTETASGSLLRARQNHVAVLLDGSVYSVGGNSTTGSPVSSVERYDPATRTSTLVAPMLEPRSGHGAVAVGGKIYAFGGMPAMGGYTASAEVYDPAANTWTPIDPMPVARFNFRAAAIGNRIYALGGFSDAAPDRVDAYDVVTRTWSFVGYLATSRTSFALGTVGSQLYAIGGYESVSPQGPVSTMELFGGSAPGTLVPGPSTQVPWGPSAASAGGLVYVVGGSTASVLQVLDPVAGTFSAPPSSWVSGAGAPLYAAPVSYAGAATDGSRLFVTGGWPGTSSVPSTIITDVPLPPSFTAPAQPLATIAAGGDSSFFSRIEGLAFSWGQNNGGQLGSGLGIGVISPVPSVVTGIPAGVESLDAAAWYGMAIDKLGGLWVWGYGPTIGQATIDNPVPLDYTPQLGTGAIVRAISAGYNGGLALRSDGTVFGFGSDGWGQLGPVTNTLAVRQIPGLSGIVAVAAGEHHTLALDSTGHVWSLGENAFGQLGVVDAIVTSRSVPAVVQGLNDVVAIAAGSWHSVALRADGTIWTWGYDANGQLGNGAGSASPVPAQVPGLSGVKAVATGNNHTLALLADGTVRAWGYNEFGQLGDGTTVDRVSPVTVTGLAGIVEVSGGEWHSMARGSNGEIYAWGSNQNGQLGAAAPVVSPSASRVPMVSVSVSPAAVTLTTGQSQAFTATVTGTGSSAVTWSVSPTPGATISTGGVFLAVTGGAYTVTATSGADPTVQATATVTVLAAPTVLLGVSPNPAAFEFPVAATLQVVATAGGPEPTGTVTFADQIHTATAGATSAGTVTAPVTCYTDFSHLPSSRVCAATATLPAWHLSGLHTVIASYGGDGTHGMAIATTDVNVEIPIPVLEFTGAIAQAGGKRYGLRVANGSQYPVEAFASQSVHACGANGSPSRTWVDIHDGTTGAFLHGYCAYSAPSDLQSISFVVPTGSTPPSSVKIRMTDWVRNFVVESLPVSLPVPVTVIVDPPTVVLTSGSTMGFVAIVTGTANPAVTWSVQEAGGGTVSSTGSYTAPATGGTYHVVATSVADPAVSGSATVTVPATAPSLSILAWAGVTKTAGPPTTWVYVGVTDSAGIEVPSAELSVTISSSASPGTEMPVPADTSFGQVGIFHSSTLAFAAGDTLTLTVVRTDPATSAVVATTSSQVHVPVGVASLTSASFLGGSVTAQWTYTSGAPEPQIFEFWWGGSDVPAFPVSPGTARSATFAIDVLPPVDLWITSYDGTTAFTGSGTGEFWGYTDEEAGFPVADLRGPAATVLPDVTVRRIGWGPGYQVTVNALVQAGIGGTAAPTGSVEFSDAAFGDTLGSASLSRPCGPLATCADLTIPTTTFFMPGASTEWTHHIGANYAGDSANQGAAGTSETSVILYRPQTWFGLSPYTGTSVTLAMIGSSLYAFGNDVKLYDSWNDSWIPVAALPGEASPMAAAANGKVYLFSATSPPQEFDPVTRQFAALANPMPTPRSDGAAVALPDGRILVVGGTDANGVSAAAEIFDPTTGNWSSAPAMPTARRYCSAAIADGKVFVVGGSNVGALATVEYLDLATGAWASGPSLTQARSSFAMSYAAGSLYVISGSTASGSMESVERLDVASMAGWVAAPSIGTGRAGGAAVTLAENGGIYVVGGMDRMENQNLATLLFFP